MTIFSVSSKMLLMFEILVNHIDDYVNQRDMENLICL